MLGASNTYSGGGSSEDNRLDSTAKYAVKFNDRVHLEALYKFSGANGAANTAAQANLGSRIRRRIDRCVLFEGQQRHHRDRVERRSSGRAARAGLFGRNSLAATISDNTAYSLMALYRIDPFKFFAGYLHIKYANPANPLSAGFNDIGGYVLAFVTNNAYNNSKTVQVYWTGVRYTVSPNLDLTAAYYGYQPKRLWHRNTGRLHDGRA